MQLRQILEVSLPTDDSTTFIGVATGSTIRIPSIELIEVGSTNVSSLFSTTPTSSAVGEPSGAPGA